jgi:hypothetical protein
MDRGTGDEGHKSSSSLADLAIKSANRGSISLAPARDSVKNWDRTGHLLGLG